MTLREACVAILGKSAAEAIIADQGINWCAVAAIAAAKTSDPVPAIKRLRKYLDEIKGHRSR